MRKYTNVHILTHMIFFTLIFAFISGCQQTTTVNEPIQETKNSLIKESELRRPETNVHGYVTLDSVPYQGAKVELKKGGNVLTYTYSNSIGYYEICVCSQDAGTGWYQVKTEVTIQGDKYGDTATFYWDELEGPWDFTKNLSLIEIVEKY